MVDNKAIVDALTKLGFSLKSFLKERGGMKTPSKWDIELRHEPTKSVHKSEFGQGSAYRVFRERFAPESSCFGSDGKYSGLVNVYLKNKSFAKQWYKKGDKAPNINHPNFKDKELADEFWNSITEPSLPELDSVVYCLVSDASLVWFGQCHGDFCSDLGYDEDSIKGKESYQACLDTANFFRRCGIDVPKLQETLFENY